MSKLRYFVFYLIKGNFNIIGLNFVIFYYIGVNYGL